MPFKIASTAPTPFTVFSNTCIQTKFTYPPNFPVQIVQLMAFNRLTKLGNHHNQKVFIISKRNIASRTPLENPGVGTHLRLLPTRKVPQAQAPLSFPIDRFVHSVVSCKWNCAIHGFCLKHNVFKLHQCCDMHQYIVPFYC